jgi:hypothetical protein
MYAGLVHQVLKTGSPHSLTVCIKHRCLVAHNRASLHGVDPHKETLMGWMGMETEIGAERRVVAVVDVMKRVAGMRVADGQRAEVEAKWEFLQTSLMRSNMGPL